MSNRDKASQLMARLAAMNPLVSYISVDAIVANFPPEEINWFWEKICKAGD